MTERNCWNRSIDYDSNNCAIARDQVGPKFCREKLSFREADYKFEGTKFREHIYFRLFNLQANLLELYFPYHNNEDADIKLLKVRQIVALAGTALASAALISMVA